MQTQGSIVTPFSDSLTFSTRESEKLIEKNPTGPAASSPFVSVYESGEGQFADPEDDELAEFIHELYDPSFSQMLGELQDEATRIHDARPPYMKDSESLALLEEHVEPLAVVGESLFEGLARELEGRDPGSIQDQEIDAWVAEYGGSNGPQFDNWGFFKKIAKIAKKAVKKAVKIAKKGVKIASKFGLGFLFKKLKALVRPLLKKVLSSAIKRLPSTLQPVARRLAKKLPYLNETVADTDERLLEIDAPPNELDELQMEFDREIAAVVYADSEADADSIIAHAETLVLDANTQNDPVEQLNLAREQLVEALHSLEDGADASPHIEQFIPMLLPALKLGIKLIGRGRVVNFISKPVARLIGRFVGRRYAKPLSRALVDAGLKLFHLEQSSSNVERNAALATAAVIEETVRRLTHESDTVLDDPELLEAAVVHAFEDSAKRYLPPVLSEEAYAERPDLLESQMGGFWAMQPAHLKKRYRKYTRALRVRLDAHARSKLEASLHGRKSPSALRPRSASRVVEAELHLFETIPGTRLSDIVRLETESPGLSLDQLTPFTPDVATVLLGESALARSGSYTGAGTSDPVGQRFYYLHVPSEQQESPHPEEGTSTLPMSITLRPAQREVTFCYYLDESEAQNFAQEVRTNVPAGQTAYRIHARLQPTLLATLQQGTDGQPRAVGPGISSRISGSRLVNKISPELMARLASVISEGVLKATKKLLSSDPQSFLRAADAPATGATLRVVLRDVNILRAIQVTLQSRGAPSTEKGPPLFAGAQMVPGYAYA